MTRGVLALDGVELTIDEFRAGASLHQQMVRLEQDGRVEPGVFVRVFSTTVGQLLAEGPGVIAWNPFDDERRLSVRRRVRMLAALPGLNAETMSPRQVADQIAGVLGSAWDVESVRTIFESAWHSETPVEKLQLIGRLLDQDVPLRDIEAQVGCRKATVEDVSTFVGASARRARRDLNAAIDAVQSGVASGPRSLGRELGWGMSKASKMYAAARAAVEAIAEAAEAEGDAA